MTSCCRESLMATVAERARSAGVFASVRLEGGLLLRCEADGAAEPAEYRVFWEGDRLWVSLVTANRWLSESIETELLHSGDKIEELIEDELVDLGYEGPSPRVEHFRSEDLEFTFRTPVPGESPDEGAAGTHLLAYEACFRQLGDMSEGEED